MNFCCYCIFFALLLVSYLRPSISFPTINIHIPSFLSETYSVGLSQAQTVFNSWWMTSLWVYKFITVFWGPSFVSPWLYMKFMLQNFCAKQPNCRPIVVFSTICCVFFCLSLRHPSRLIIFTFRHVFSQTKKKEILLKKKVYLTFYKGNDGDSKANEKKM